MRIEELFVLSVRQLSNMSLRDPCNPLPCEGASYVLLMQSFFGISQSPALIDWKAMASSRMTWLKKKSSDNYRGFWPMKCNREFHKMSRKKKAIF